MKKLSQRVQRALVLKIKQEEIVAGQEDRFVRCDDYLSLARLYNSESDYLKEISVLNRFIHLGRAAIEDMPLVEERLSEAKALLHEQRQLATIQKHHSASSKKSTTPVENSKRSVTTQLPNTNQEIPSLTLDEIFASRHPPSTEETSNARSKTQSRSPYLSLVGEEPKLADPWQSIRHASQTSYTQQQHSRSKPKQNEQPFNTIKLVSVCAAYTGKSNQDEIYELSLVAFEYCKNNDRVIRILDEYYGCRKTLKKIGSTSQLRLSRELSGKLTYKLDDEKINALVKDATCLISHNDPYIERQHFICLFPHLSHLPWRSSQQDIPWGAYGFENNRLTHLLSFYKIASVTRTARDRAKGIVRLLSKEEPEFGQSFLHRLLSCNPMRPFNWYPEIREQSNRLLKKRFRLPFV